MLKSLSAKFPWEVMAAVVGLVLAVTALVTWQHFAEEADRARAGIREAGVRRLLDREPLANMGLPANTAFSPFRNRGEQALMKINPGLAKPVGPTIDSCRTVTGGLPAELVLKRKVVFSDMTSLGTSSSRSTGNVGNLAEIEFFTYGHLDVGVKDGAIVAVRVR